MLQRKVDRRTVDGQSRKLHALWCWTNPGARRAELILSNKEPFPRRVALQVSLVEELQKIRICPHKGCSYITRQIKCKWQLLFDPLMLSLFLFPTGFQHASIGRDDIFFSIEFILTGMR